ncbi:MAG: DMT family transporter [Candidatus Peribacteraceae bacterium]|nr:DMT family transporter [Candidatus Peribacteraceae bacterium]
MFFALAIGSMLGYTLQSVLLTRAARSIDGLSLAFYRNISFIITLLPLLLGTDRTGIVATLNHWPLLLASGISGGVYLALYYTSLRYIPLGIAAAYNKAIGNGVITLAAFVILDERLNAIGILSLVAIVAGTVALATGRTHLYAHLQNHRLRGFLLIAGGSAFVSFTVFSLGIISRMGNPLAAAYFWEVFIGIGCVPLLIGRRLTTGHAIQRITLKQFLIIALCASPTLIGTGLISLATSMGSIAVANIIGTVSLALTAVIAWLFHEEPLKRRQWLSIILIVCGAMGLKLV